MKTDAALPPQPVPPPPPPYPLQPPLPSTGPSLVCPGISMGESQTFTLKMNPGGRDPVMGGGLSALPTAEVGQGSPSFADKQGSPERLGGKRVSPATVQPPLMDATINEADAISKLTETLKEFGVSERTRHTKESERDKLELKTKISSLETRVKQLTEELDTANKKAAAANQTLEGHGGDLPSVLDAYKAVVASREKLHRAETERNTAVLE